MVFGKLSFWIWAYFQERDVSFREGIVIVSLRHFRKNGLKQQLHLVGWLNQMTGKYAKGSNLTLRDLHVRLQRD